MSKAGPFQNGEGFLFGVAYQTRLPTHEGIKGRSSTWPDANVALITGQISGVIVVDIDTQEGYDNLNEYSDHRNFRRPPAD